MSTSIQPLEEVFPGYQLTERIGSGGYAEVWRARAPGGIDKAVKIVYGYYDDQLAAQEMKAMERIKDVRHPFVLSLERFEVVDGRLAILTELADMSLEQRAQQCRAGGLPGIPRDELLRLMADAAEALDYLAQRHSLQHLDIKPANLLISGEHLKVADFGLVKELASRTQNSMVAGMTPTYSSPEMFDDAPSPQSDQYSLAIVYQEMLTGVLPFPGRTAAQLANQHLRSQPQLEALGQIDRSAVARALAKNPSERFALCRAFVQALQGACDLAPTPSTAFATPPAANEATPSFLPVSDSKSKNSTLARPRATVDTKAEAIPACEVRLKEDIVDVSVPTTTSTVNTTSPTLYIAVGGVGIRILCLLRDLLARRDSASQQRTPVEMIALDTDRAEIKNACSARWRNPLPSTDALYLPLKLPQVYREQGSNLEWLSHRWLYNIPRSLETRGYRPLGRLAVVDHVDKVLPLIDRKLAQLTTVSGGDDQQQESSEVRVVVLVGMGGGTGSGMAIDLANAARSRLQASAHRGQVQGVLVCTCLENTKASPLSVANTYALLRELQFVSMFGNQGAKVESSSLLQLESRHRPFDLVYMAKAVHGANQSVDEGLCAIASRLALASTDGVRQMLQCCQQTATPRELAGHDSLWLRAFGSASLAGPAQKRIDRVANSVAHVIKQHWLSDACPDEWQRIERAGEAGSSLANPFPEGDVVETSQVAPFPSTPPAEWRRGFGQHASTQFAYEVVAWISRQSIVGDSCRTLSLSSTHPATFIELASQAIGSIGKQVAELSTMGNSLSDEEELIVNQLASNSHQILTKLIEEIEQMSADSVLDAGKVDRIILIECAAAAKELLGKPSTGAVDLASTRETDAKQVLDGADVDLLQCGYDRRTLMIEPLSDRTSEAFDALGKARPTAAIVSAEVDQAVVLCEASGISPSSVARGLERVYPGVAEAAGRLFTRVDIDWSAWTL